MDLYEFQAKELFNAHGVPGTRGVVVTDADAAEQAATDLGTAVVVKSQVKTGGRGKAGGVKLAATPAEAKEKAQAILGLVIKGHETKQVLVTEATDIAEEYYVSFLLDRSNRTFLAMASKEGGMEIEQLAVERPEALARIPVDAVANGIVGALQTLGDEATKPLVVRLDGNNVAEGRRILEAAGHPMVTLVDTMDAAADKAAELAAAAARTASRKQETHSDGNLPRRGLADHRPGHDRQ